MATDVYINRIETSVPAHDGHAKFLSFLPHVVTEPRIERIIQRLASKCQIDHRHSVLASSEDPDELDQDGLYKPGAFASTAVRMERYRKEALPLASRAVGELLPEPRDREGITHLVITSCTGFYAPGLDLELQKQFGFRTDLERSIIGFMGCYAAFNGMKAAYHIVRSQPEAKVLLVNIEICSLHMQESGDPEKVLGFMQFADGCAASLISAEPRGLKLDQFRAEVLSNDAELIRWTIGDSGFEMVLDTEVPAALGRALPGLMPRLMSSDRRAATKLWAIHPGGRAILDVVQQRLELTDKEIQKSRDVLRENGNMSSATVMFVMKRILEDDACTGAGAAMAFGPGLTVESLLFTKPSKESSKESRA